MQCKDCEYNKETNLFHTEKYCMRLGAICGLLGCGEGIPKVKTNADRIRSMTDEELADEILRWFNWLNAVDWQSDRIINWLKDEVKNNG